MIAVITGAAGFVGSHLVDRYLADGYHVIGLDNFITGSPANLAEAERSPRFRFVETDVSSGPDAIITAVGEAAPSLILHLASPASPIDYAQRPLETMWVNSKGTEAALEAAKRFGSGFLFASTSESYGDPLQHPQTETYWGNVNPVGPRSCYDEAKRFGEALVMTYVRVYGLNARIARIFNTYGPRMRLNDGRVVPNFVRQAIDGAPLTVFGDGTQTRSFCYVDDLVDGLARLAACDAAIGRVVNLGNPTEFTILAFAELVAECTGVALHVEARPLPQDDPSRRCPDIGLAKSLLEWNPRVPLREGLKRTIEAFRRELAAASAG